MQNRVMIGVANGAAAGALWGLIFLMPEVLHAFSALQLAASRYLAYGAVAAMLLLPRWRRATASLGRAEWRALLWLSLLGNIVYYICVALAVRWRACQRPRSSSGSCRWRWRSLARGRRGQ